LQILTSCVHFLGRIEASGKIARKIRREFQFFHSLGSEKWAPVSDKSRPLAFTILDPAAEEGLPFVFVSVM